MNILNNNLKKGFSLIEIMVALIIGAILLTGLITVFETSSVMNRTQNGLARIQENGRFAIVNIKHHAEQAGYQYCLASTLGAAGTNEASMVKPWMIYSSTISDGLPTRADIIANSSQDPEPTSAGSTLPYLLDSAYLIHGHECDSAACVPALDTLGSATQFTIPDIGTADGERLAGTDVLTFRYISGTGIAVDSIVTAASTTATITYHNTESSYPASGSNVVIAGCDGQAARVITLGASSSTGATSTIDGDIVGTGAGFTRLFDFDNDVSVVSYYVANNQISDNGKTRDIPTLYSVINGVSNALIEGVDRFDVLYGVKNNLGEVLILDATGVENLPPSECIIEPISKIGKIVNIAGCGWRSVVSMEVHLLLNTIFDSSVRNNEPYKYSLDGNNFQMISVLNGITGINNYRMHRKEFVANIVLKNY